MHNHNSSRATTRPASEGLASWYTPGLVDGFGDRLLMYDNTSPDVLELLRFSTALVDTPGFEELVRYRVMQLRGINHPALPIIRAVERLEGDGSLALVSAHASGKRLSSILAGDGRGRRKLHPAFVTWLLRQITEPLALLESVAGPAGHGTVNAERLILTPDGRVQIIEHVLGPALRSLNATPERLWRDFGLLVRPESVGSDVADSRSDVFQLGTVALSLLLARRVTPADVDQRLPELLNQWSESQAAPTRDDGEPLRNWLERALQVGEVPFGTTAEALAELRQLPAPSSGRAMDLLATAEEVTPAPPAVFPVASYARNQEGSMDSLPTKIPVRQVSPPVPSDEFPLESEPPLTRSPPRRHLESPRMSPWVASAHAADASQAAPVRQSRRPPVWVGVALSIVAVAEAVVIAALLQRGPTAAANAVETVALGEEVARRAAQPIAAGAGAVATPPGSASVGTATPATSVIEPAGENPAIARAARNQRSGGIRLTSPIDLTVLTGDRVLGSTADGPIIATEGTHQLEFVNTALGFRERRAVTFKAGEIATLDIAVPRGRLSVNAQPWAEVWIDNRQVGETPLANLDIAIGEHEIVFRHPSLGERRHNVLVRADTAARVTTTFDR